jgi:enhancing lycopene biosynthesis protein 2
MTKRIGVLLAGCGHRDGSEIHEATLTLLAIEQCGQEAVCIAPDGPQRLVMNHLTGEVRSEQRDIRIESARIARGKVRDAARTTVADIDALIIPGGQGAALNLSTFLADGVNCEVEKDVKRLILEVVRAKKPLGAICIAPATVAKALEGSGITTTLTVGHDNKVAAQIEQMGAKHESCATINCVIDRENKIVTTPAYMNAKNIAEVWQGIDKLVRAVIEMCG